ncbi:MAG TPA: tetratricopeptide repeat protein [Caulobacteraceae bacterium]|jgi:Tfp pilus assembly protein PilF
MSTPEIQAALAALQTGRKAEALALVKASGAAAADDPLALQIWSVCLEGEASRAEALALLERAVRIAPNDIQAHFNLAVSLQAAQDLPRAIAHYQQTLALAPGHQGALNNLSDLLRRRGRAEEGWELMQRYLAGGGEANGMQTRLAKLALDTRRFDEAETWFQAARVAAPGDPRVAFEHAMVVLAQEDFAQGWPLYEARLDAYGLGNLAIYPYDLPAWDGEARAGANILLHREQGLGDMIMFASAVRGIIEAGATPHLAMAPSLNRLFAESFPAARVWSSQTVAGEGPQPLQPFLQVCGPLDSQAPMASLGALRMPAGPPPPQPYLRPPAAEVARWKARMDQLAPPRVGERRVGLVIGARLPRYSDDGMTNGTRKSLPAAELEPLAEVANVRFFSLHDRDSSAQVADVPRLPIVDLSPWITDFADTAAAIANLDLVISVDTAVAHLAGAMGKPLWLLLWLNADWRWGIEREDSLWYPQVRAFRQVRAGGWGEVVEQVSRALG